MRLVVGLGNPGRAYVGTRHNVGFDAVDVLAQRLGWARKREDFDRQARSQFDGLTMQGPLGSQGVMLFKPLTFMNESGRAVQAASAFFQIAPQEVLIILDDLALPCGKIRLRAGGSNGGHNGLKDIERALGTSQYPRLRLGIDPAMPPLTGRDYVLGRFSDEQRVAIDPALDRAAEAAMVWIESDIETAMNRFNSDLERNA
jgi:PTH1 family peptidyl-tRNA hydrolase